jgi:hypothetical protein
MKGSGKGGEGLRSARSESAADINTPSILSVYAFGPLKLAD